MSLFQDPSVSPEEVQRLSLNKDEVSREQLDGSFRLNQEVAGPLCIKEEPEDLWGSQEGERLQGPVEDDIIKFTFVPVTVKSEDDAEKPQSAMLYQRKNKQKETGADEEDCGGSEAARYFDREKNVQPEIEVEIEDFSDPDTDDSADWKERTEPQSGLNTVKEVKNKRRKTDKSYSCSECGKKFDQKTNLTRHETVHTTVKPFSCSECGKTFAHKDYLSKHMIIHTGEKPFSCLECGKKFNQKCNLVMHKSVHTGEKPFSCSICGKTFTLKRSVTTHMITHTGEKPFSCSECGKSFTQRGNLNQHMIVHSGEKPFICSVCGQKFSYDSNLRSHMAGHRGEKPFSCSECGKSFKFNYYLTLHMAHHRGEKPFTCSECGKSFKYSYTLKIHTAHHRDEKPFSCDVCDQKFAWPTQLKKHKCVGSQASEPLQNQTGKKKKAKTRTDGEDWGGSEPVRNSDPDTQLQPETKVKTEDFSEPEIEDDDNDWKEIREHE
ncbi:zinc finger protein OZF-like [Cheilinus undulatus]|uniref:zinc finger protein OZF-like n=1 Tax=Cheilinus undulatus TaxID=241271 RepID=UPI001BD4002B|nr:zinc finger protein OZF-like [Cheilinus undulatus]